MKKLLIVALSAFLVSGTVSAQDAKTTETKEKKECAKKSCCKKGDKKCKKDCKKDCKHDEKEGATKEEKK